MNAIPFYSDRRPLRYRLFLIATLLLLIAGPMTTQRFVNIGAGGVFEIEVANGVAQLNAPAVSSANFQIQTGGIYGVGYGESAIPEIRQHLLPTAEFYNGIQVQVPWWILVCVAFALYRRSRRKFEAAERDANWCRACGHTLQASVAQRCAKCGHLADGRGRVSIARWLATGLRQDLVCVNGRWTTAFRAAVATLIFCFIILGLASTSFTGNAFEDSADFLGRTLPSCELFLPLFTVVMIAFGLTRLALVAMFVERPFATARAPRAMA
ncbi:MAG TPA: hypothetical protein P5081_02375 [Phycisphaerae bacterium]|nr:hypothetical protein [Phycisphaerae bacterium]HRW51703.1 hypothetical protein [Phycisphaerae bacterium]